MHSSREDYQPRDPFGRARPGPVSSLLFRRTPFLLAAVALMAVFFASGPHHAAAQSSNTFTVSDITVVEGGSADITVTLSAQAPTGGVEFSAAASYDTPAAGKAASADVQSVASSLTIAQGQTTGAFTVAAAKDTTDEGAETFSVTVTAGTSGWSPASTGDNVSTVTIHDPVRFAPRPDKPSESRAGIGHKPDSTEIILYLEVGATISIQFPEAASGTGNGDYTYALGGPERFYKSATRRSIPTGLSFDAATRTLSGSPTGLDANGVTTLGSNRLMNYHVWDGTGEDGPDGDGNTEDNHDELKVSIRICPAGSAAEADGATACKYTAGLYSLEVSHGSAPVTPVALSPTFTTDNETYTATVADSVAAVDLAVIPEHLNVSRVEMTVNGTAGRFVETTDPSGRLLTGTADLNLGANTITVKVESGANPAHDVDEQGDPIPVFKTYTLTVNRGTTTTVVVTPEPPPVVGFGSAAYSGTEGDTITIQLRLAEAQDEPFRIWVRSDLSSTADLESDFSFGDCLPGETSCEFGIGVLEVEIPVGETTYSYGITTVDDHMVEENETFTLDLAYFGSPFAPGDNSQAEITIMDNDEAGVTVSTETVTMDEDTSGNEETAATYTIKLQSQPDDWVRVYAESAFPCKVTVLRGFVEFSRHNWNQAQTLRVRSYHDYDAVDEEVVVSHRIETGSRAAEYKNETVAAVTVKVDDQHAPALMVEKSSLAPTVGGTAEYRVYLSADPRPIYGASPANCFDYTTSHTVIVTASSSDSDKATVSPASVTFTADDYGVKTFTVTGVAAGDISITHAVSGTDPAYTGAPLVLQNVNVSIPAQQQSAQEPPSLPQEGQEAEASQLPGPVQEVRLTAAADRVTVRWSPPETGQAPTRYIVHIAPVGGGKGETKTLKAKRSSVTFRNLEAGKSYRIFVRAKNQAGNGPRVKAIVTLPDASPG